MAIRDSGRFLLVVKSLFGRQGEMILFRATWFAYGVAILFGSRSRYLTLAMIPVTVACWAVARSRDGRSKRAFISLFESANSFHLKWVWALGIVLLGLAAFFAQYLSFEGMVQPLYDWGSYYQGTYNAAVSGVASLTPGDRHFDAARYHPTVSLPVVAFLYAYFPSPLLLMVWHTIFLFLPVVLLLLGFRRILGDAGIARDPFSEMLLVFVYVTNPVVAGNLQWPYVWHSAGVFFFGVAYYAFWLKRLWICFFALLLFLLHKGEFALFASAFAGAIGLDKRVPVRQRLTWAILIFVIGIAYYGWAARNSVSAFVDRFGNLGATPREALAHLLTEPGRYFRAWSSWESIRFMSFFLFASLGLLARTRLVFILSLPALPFLFLYGASEFDTMRSFSHHYALPLMIAFFAVLIYGVLPFFLGRHAPGDRGKDRRHLARAFLVSVLCISAIWAQGTPFHSFRLAMNAYRARSADRIFLAPLRDRREEVICCDYALCTYLSDRPVILLSEACLAGSQLLTNLNAKRVGYLVRAGIESHLGTAAKPGLAKAPLPKKWEYRSSELQFGWANVE